MEGLYPCCIFCAVTLPPLGQRGRGEHIIPAFLSGSWSQRSMQNGAGAPVSLCLDTHLGRVHC